MESDADHKNGVMAWSVNKLLAPLPGALSHCMVSPVARRLNGERGGMNFIESLALIGASIVLLIIGRGRGGEGLDIFNRLPWVVGVLSVWQFYIRSLAV